MLPRKRCGGQRNVRFYLLIYFFPLGAKEIVSRPALHKLRVRLLRP